MRDNREGSLVSEASVSLTVHAIEASASPPGTDCVTLATLQQLLASCCRGKPDATVASVGCCFFILTAAGMFVELEPFRLLKKKKNVNGRVQKRAHLRGRGSGRGLRGLLGVAGGSRRLLRD